MIGYVVKRIITSEYLAFILRICVGYFFIYASMSKIPYPEQFAEAVANYQLIPYWMLNLGAVLLPWIEFVCGLFLIIGFKSRASVAIIGGLLVMFNVMVLINMYRGAPISCGCYDTVGEPIGWKKILENIALLVFAIQIFFHDRLFIFRRGEFSVATKKRVPSPATPR